MSAGLDSGNKKYRSAKGNGLMMFSGILITSMGMGVLMVDLPAYYTAQNELQTAVNAAAIAGAYALPDGAEAAEAAAYEVAAKNPVAGHALNESDLEYEYTGTGANANMKMSVSAHASVNTIIGKMICALGGHGGGSNQLEPQDGWSGQGQWNDDEGSASVNNCNVMTVYAKAKAIPAARDTILVIDTSSSMSQGSGTGVPVNNVRTAANYFVDTIKTMSDSAGTIDRIGVVTFDQSSTKRIGLTSKTDQGNTGFTKVKNTINTYITTSKLFSGSGWNTNYEAGLKVALDELQNNGRKNAKKSIIFLTDGYPNLPAPKSLYSGNNMGTAYQTCINKINNAQVVKNLCYNYKKNGKTYQQCYYAPNDWPNPITNAMIVSSGGFDCGKTYTDYMIAQTQAQVTRAENLDVTIHTIQMFDPAIESSSTRTVSCMMKDTNWDPELLDYFATNTDGEQYSSKTANTSELQAIYTAIAADVSVKLAD